jgi:DNA repair exonuclease SbcCD ATPase subunit
MEEIKRQVNRAQRRLIGEQFLAIVVWSLFATLLIGAVGLAIPKIWALPTIKQDIWNYSWLGGSVVVGLVIAMIWTYVVRRSSIDAAIELDRRYGLKERVSSTLALAPSEMESEIGKALVADAIRKVERIDVREQFRIQPTWRFALPIVPMLVIGGLLFVPNASIEKKAAANTQASVDIKKALTKQVEKIKNAPRKEEKKDKSEEELKTEQAMKEIAKKLEELTKTNNLDQKQIKIELNNMKADVEKRQKELGGAQEMKKQLDKLGKIEKGPADKMADALKNGDFKEAKKAMDQLKDDLKNGKLNEKEKEQLAKQMNDMKDKLNQMAADQKEAREKVEQELAKKLAQGDQEGAAKLREKLDQMEKDGQKAEKMLEQLAQKMGECAECMKPGGDPKAAGEKLDQLAKAMKEAQEQLDQIENLDEVLDQLAECKNCMNGKEGGEGKDGKPGDLAGKSKQMSNKRGKGGDGLGAAKGGSGERPENEVDTNTYDTQVQAKTQPGESVRIGDAGGKNIPGKSLQQAKAEIQSAAAKDPDALEEVNLPREMKNQTKQYFEKFRKGG